MGWISPGTTRVSERHRLCACCGSFDLTSQIGLKLVAFHDVRLGDGLSHSIIFATRQLFEALYTLVD